MPSIEYSLFRANFIKPVQQSFLHDNLTSREVFIRAINDRPLAELRKGYTWHIGNFDTFTDSAGYFAIGRTTKATIKKFDEKTGNFLEEELSTSLYTHCVYDASIGFVGIARKNSLAGTAKGIASMLERLFSHTNTVLQNEITVEIAPIPDPDGFLKALTNAHRVTKFSATFRGPNPFDADEHFQRPLAFLCSKAQAAKGKAQVQGEDLNRDVLKGIARSTAATGNEASAMIVTLKGHKAHRVNLSGDPIKRRYDEMDHDPKQVLEDLINLYKKVRTNE